MKSQLGVTRPQYAEFLKNPDAIREFERLFSVGARFEDYQYSDVDFPIIVRTVGAGIPSLAVLNGNITMPQWQVNDVNICEAQEIPHSWRQGTEAYWHLHLTTNGLDATNRYVRFNLEYGYVAVDGVWTFAPAVTTADLLIPANTSSKTMLVFNLATFTPKDGVGGHVVARLQRVASVGAAPTSNPFIPMLQLHVLSDTLGSRTVNSK
jgi:hypothetical protein